MEEPGYEYDWRHPIKVPNENNKSGISVEKGSFEWFKYWLETGCTYQEIADKFHTSKSTVVNIAKLFKWDERKSNKEDYISRQREKQIIIDYADFLEQTQRETDEEIQLIRVAILDLSVKLGFMEHPDTNEKRRDDDIDYIKGLKAYGSLINALKELRAMRYRSLEQPDKRNDKQEIVKNNTPEIEITDDEVEWINHVGSYD